MGPDVVVLVPRLLQPLVGGRANLQVEVGAEASVQELLDVIGAEFPVFDRRVRDETGALRRYVNIYVAGNDVRRGAGLQSKVVAGQEVMIIQSVAGG